MKCQSCNSENIVDICGHSKDLAQIEYKGITREGYLPEIENICGGDDIQIKVCLECGQMQGSWPAKIDDIMLDCFYCAEDIVIPLGELGCPVCGEVAYSPKYFDAKPKEHGGMCKVVVGVSRCKLLIPFEFEGLPHRPIGHEMIVQWTSDVHIGVTYMGNELRLERGIEAELI